MPCRWAPLLLLLLIRAADKRLRHFHYDITPPCRCQHAMPARLLPCCHAAMIGAIKIRLRRLFRLLMIHYYWLRHYYFDASLLFTPPRYADAAYGYYLLLLLRWGYYDILMRDALRRSQDVLMPLWAATLRCHYHFRHYAMLTRYAPRDYWCCCRAIDMSAPCYALDAWYILRAADDTIFTRLIAAATTLYASVIVARGASARWLRWWR